MTEFRFNVYDQEGFWGGVRVETTDAETAETKCRAFLIEEHVEPNGSLEAEFELRPVDAENAEGSIVE